MSSKFGQALLVAALAAFALLALAGPAAAHPLGNFSINHLDRVKVSSDRVDVQYVLDQAEIPTFQERGMTPPAVLQRKLAEIRRGLKLTVNGRTDPLILEPGAKISFPQGQGGLKLTRVEARLHTAAHDPRAVALHDGTFPDRVGWKAIVSQPGDGTYVRTGAPSGDPTDGLRKYPQDLLQSPLDRRDARFTVKPGNGTLVAPEAEHGKATTQNRGGSDGFAAVFADAAAGKGVLLLLFLAAFAWGAFHALSPGHGKAMVAAYLVGTRGTAKHAVALGATVTITHTIGVFALGLVTLLLSQYILPEDLYPWLTLASGVLVVVVGLGVLRSRIRWGRARRAEATHSPGHSHGDDHSHAHGHDHSHAPPEQITWRGLVTMGASAGLIPCPSALVVLLGAIAQHQVVLGLGLILAFSLGLAATLTILGIGVLYAQRFAGRLSGRLSFSSRLGAAVPALSALVIVGVGLALTLNAVPQVV